MPRPEFSTRATTTVHAFDAARGLGPGYRRGVGPGMTEWGGVGPGMTEWGDVDPGTREWAGVGPGTTEWRGVGPGTKEWGTIGPGMTGSCQRQSPVTASASYISALTLARM